MATRDLIVLGTSAGGVEALVRLVQGLPKDLPAALLVVQHRPPDVESKLAYILSHSGALPASQGQDGEAIEPGHIYVAPPDYHLLVEPGRMRLSHEARENRFRPAIDPLFRSAARHYGPRVVAVLLTGGANDGVAGLMAVRNAGGVAIVQDPQEALVPELPRSAIEIAGADHVVPVAELPALLTRLVCQEPKSVSQNRSATMIDPIEQMPEKVDHDMAAQERGEREGDTSVYSCPECGGVLWQVKQNQPIRFRCHVGHAYYAEQLFTEQAELLEAALWTAVRIFRERSTLSRQLAAVEASRGNIEMARRYEENARLAEGHSDAIVQHLLHSETGIFPPSQGGNTE